MLVSANNDIKEVHRLGLAHSALPRISAMAFLICQWACRHSTQSALTYSEIKFLLVYYITSIIRTSGGHIMQRSIVAENS